MSKQPLREKLGQPEESPWHRLISFNYLRIALVIGLSYALAYGLCIAILNPLHVLQSSVVANMLFYVLAYGMIGVLICLILERRRRAIEPVEMNVWSWRALWRNLITPRHWGSGLLVGLLVGSIMGLSMELRLGQPTTALIFGLNGGWVFGLSYWLLPAISNALSIKMIDEHSKPNQGIWNSAGNSIIIGIISGCLSWLVCGLIYMLGFTLSYTLNSTFIDNLGAALIIERQVASGLGLFVGLSIGLLCSLLNGGLAFLQHWVLRLLLWHAGTVPWSYSRFLDYATQRILLRKVGGGYIFIHQELLEYFASLN
jgi:hypothetical protein